MWRGGDLRCCGVRCAERTSSLTGLRSSSLAVEGRELPSVGVLTADFCLAAACLVGKTGNALSCGSSVGETGSIKGLRDAGELAEGKRLSDAERSRGGGRCFCPGGRALLAALV